MNITLRLEQGDVDLDIDAAADTTVGDLVAVLATQGWCSADHGQPRQVQIDGRRAALDHSLDEVGCGDGSLVEVGGEAIHVDHPERRTQAFHHGAGVRLGVSGGLDAGRWLPVAAGRHRIGRGTDALIGHVTTSGRHATLDVEPSGRVTVTDHGSRNGTWVDGMPVVRSIQVGAGQVMRTGALTTRVEDVPPTDRPQVDDRAFNRPPRPAPAPAPQPLCPPTRAGDGQQARPAIPIASVVGGLAMGAVMYAMTGTLMYAAMAFMAPILSVMTAVSARRKHGRQERQQSRLDRRERAEFVEAVRAASDQASDQMRQLFPDLAEVVRRATSPSIRLWERRLDHQDALHLVIGHATRHWDPPMENDGRVDEGVAEIIAQEAWLREVPIVAPGGVVGIVGDRAAALAVARSLVAQACVHHGPADLEAVLVTPDVLAWDGAKWLPHLRDAASGLPRAVDPMQGRAVLADLLERRRAMSADASPGSGQGGPRTDVPSLLVILDGVETCEGRDAPGRSLLRGQAGPVLGVVVAASLDRLPASCDTVVVLEGSDGACRVTRPTQGEVVPGVLASGMSEQTLATVARAVARFDDPESSSSRDLPQRAALPDLFEAPPTTAARVAAAWERQRREGRLTAPIGMTAAGPLVIDLNADGPHALVAGTTGAGKSELLRSLVAGLAAGADPDHVAFVLVDYKGGAAFDRCAELPHVAGLVTDLDDDLAERALVCLQAELHRREVLLRAQSVADLDAYRRLPVADVDPLPDLVVVIDEFATLATELPDFLDSLVGIAQRGRSLGVHLVLATQRPSGVVSDDIRANTNLRIALRVQDRQDSTDVIEDGAAATLTRDQPGRAFVRLGPGNLVAMQSALVTGPSRGEGQRVTIRPFGLVESGHEAPALELDPSTDLEVLVRAVNAAFESSGRARPREPWPAPLPSTLPLVELAEMQEQARRGTPGLVDLTADGAVVVGLADDPRQQRRRLAGWDPTLGSLLICGAMGSGATSTLRTLVTSAARMTSPSELHVHVLDAGRGDLVVLDGLPHVSGVVRLGEDERVARLVARLSNEVDRRRRDPGEAASAPRWLLAIDDWEAFTGAHELGASITLVDDLTRVIVEGPSVGIVTMLTVGRAGGVNSRLLSSMAQRWVLRLPDETDGGMLGVAGAGSLPVGRVIDASTGERLQVAHDEHASVTVAEVARAHAGTAGPAPIACLPTRVDDERLPAMQVGDQVWALPVGVRGDDLGVALLRLHPGEHALIAGAARSGRSTLLASLATRAAAQGVTVVTCGGRGELDVEAPGVRAVSPSGLVAELTARHGATVPTLVVVDDAELIDAPGMEAALAGLGANVHVVASARADTARSSYGHWVRSLARSRVGLLLSPDIDLDGDLFGVRLPRQSMAPPAPGRGWLVDAGEVVQCQPACPTVPVANPVR